MRNIVAKYRNLAMALPDHIGEAIAIVMYLSFMVSISGAALSFASGAYFLAILFSIGTIFITTLIYLL